MQIVHSNANHCGDEDNDAEVRDDVVCTCQTAEHGKSEDSQCDARDA